MVLSNNKIASLRALSPLRSLASLDASSNRLTKARAQMSQGAGCDRGTVRALLAQPWLSSMLIGKVLLYARAQVLDFEAGAGAAGCLRHADLSYNLLQQASDLSAFSR